MRALLDDPAIFQHHDPVSRAHRGEAVGDHQRGAALHQPVQGLLHQLLAFRIERAGRFVEQQDRRIPQQRASNGNALLLPARKLRPAFAKIGVEPVGQLAQEAFRIGGARSVPVRLILEAYVELLSTLPPGGGGDFDPAAEAFRDYMRRRHSVRQYSTDPVPEAVITACIQAAGTSPSGANHQPWHFVAISDPVLKARIRAGAEEEERAFYSGGAPDEWLAALEPIGTGADKPHLTDAPWLIVIFAQRYGVTQDGIMGTIGLASASYIWVQGFPTNLIVQRMFNNMDSFLLLAVPMFMPAFMPAVQAP